jgi:hypothetical protein
MQGPDGREERDDVETQFELPISTTNITGGFPRPSTPSPPAIPRPECRLHRVKVTSDEVASVPEVLRTRRHWLSIQEPVRFEQHRFVTGRGLSEQACRSRFPRCEKGVAPLVQFELREESEPTVSRLGGS